MTLENVTASGYEVFKTKTGKYVVSVCYPFSPRKTCELSSGKIYNQCNYWCDDIPDWLENLDKPHTVLVRWTKDYGYVLDYVMPKKED